MIDQPPTFTLVHDGSIPTQLSVEQYDFSTPLGSQTTVSDGLWTIRRMGDAMTISGYGKTWTIAQPTVAFLTDYDPEAESPPVLVSGSQSLTVHRPQRTPDIPITRFDLNGEQIDGPSWLYAIFQQLAEETRRNA
jgi:hypothetical protein